MTKRNGHNPRPSIEATITVTGPVDEHARAVAQVNEQGRLLREQKDYARRRVDALIEGLADHCDLSVVKHALENAAEILGTVLEKRLLEERQKRRGRR